MLDRASSHEQTDLDWVMYRRSVLSGRTAMVAAGGTTYKAAELEGALSSMTAARLV